MKPEVLRVALTGGIATGKSHVLARFAERGVPTIDADRLARQVLERGSPAWATVRSHFGPDVLQADGEIDRRRLADTIFAHPRARRTLEAIVHPEVYRRIEAWFASVADGDEALAVADIPLLFETGHQADVDCVIVAACSPQTQRQRLMSRDGLSEAEARQRVAAQWPIAEKAARADYVIDTDRGLEETDNQIERIYRALLEEVARRA